MRFVRGASNLDGHTLSSYKSVECAKEPRKATCAWDHDEAKRDG